MSLSNLSTSLKGTPSRSIQVFKLPPISFYKIIEMVVKADIGLSRDSIRHINGIEENILEEMAWTHDSPLWGTLSRRADGVPSSESIWTYGIKLADPLPPFSLLGPLVTCPGKNS